MGLFVSDLPAGASLISTSHVLTDHPHHLLSHANSVDKLESGDYLLSARHTSTIYLISHIDGSIIWRLGGQHSNFTMLDNLTFSSQHDARVRSANATTTVISLLDNASNSVYTTNTSAHSSALYILLDHASTPPTARAIRSLPRPDGGFTRLRGNVQLLPNGNTFVGWSENNLVSEFAPDGRPVFEAHFQTHRYDVYRSYKFPWTAFAPSEPPAVRALAYGSPPDRVMTAVYVSWNGASEVAMWRFHGMRGEGAQQRVEVIAEIARNKFETVAMVDGLYTQVWAEAFMSDGRRLGRSANVTVELPDDDWNVEPMRTHKVPAEGSDESADAAHTSSSKWKHGNGAEFLRSRLDVTAVLVHAPTQKMFGVSSMLVFLVAVGIVVSRPWRRRRSI